MQERGVGKVDWRRALGRGGTFVLSAGGVLAVVSLFTGHLVTVAGLDDVVWYPYYLAIHLLTIWALQHRLREIPRAAERRFWNGISLAFLFWASWDAVRAFFPQARAPFNLRTVIEDCLDLIAPIAARKGLETAYYLERPLHERLAGDAARTRQILLNLLNNAVKFTERGEIRVVLDHRDLGDGRREARFTVSDTGVGIAAEELGQLFKPFSQIDSSMTRGHGGTGLGLAICSRLCELMAGRIWVESTVGRGSSFHFTIPGPSSSFGGSARVLSFSLTSTFSISDTGSASETSTV